MPPGNVANREDLPELPQLDSAVQQFMGPDGKPISREQYETLRLEIYRRTGRDPAQVYDVGAPPPEEAQDGSPDSAETEGTTDSGPEEG